MTATTVVLPVYTVITDNPVVAAVTALQTINRDDTANIGTATASSGAATLNKISGTITSEALTTAAGADYTLTLTNSTIAATSRVFATPDNGTNTTAGMAVGRVTPAAGSVVILVRNTHASVAWNGTIKVNFAVMG